MKVLIIFSTLTVIALAQYGSVASDPSTTSTQVQYQYQANPYYGNWFYEQYGPYYRHPRNHHRRRHHHRHHDEYDQSEFYDRDGWAVDGFEGYAPPPFFPYPNYQPVIYTNPSTSVVASDPSTIITGNYGKK